MRCTGRGRPEAGRELATVLRGVTGIVGLALRGDQALASLLPSAAQDFPSALGFHAGAEPELAFASPFRGLIRAFHGRVRQVKTMGALTPGWRRPKGERED